MEQSSLGSWWPASQELGRGSHLVQMQLTNWLRWEVEECTKIRSAVKARIDKPWLKAAGKTRLYRDTQA